MEIGNQKKETKKEVLRYGKEMETAKPMKGQKDPEMERAILELIAKRNRRRMKRKQEEAEKSESVNE